MNKLFSFFAFLSLVITSKNTFSMHKTQSWADLCDNAKEIANKNTALDLNKQQDKIKLQNFLFFVSSLDIDKLLKSKRFKTFFSKNNHLTYENCMEIMQDYKAKYKNKENVVQEFNIKKLKVTFDLEAIRKFMPS